MASVTYTVAITSQKDGGFPFLVVVKASDGSLAMHFPLRNKDQADAKLAFLVEALGANSLGRRVVIFSPSRYGGALGHVALTSNRIDRALAENKVTDSQKKMFKVVPR